jgi:hypothetical protein
LDGGDEVNRGYLRVMVMPLRDWKEQALELVAKKYFLASAPTVTIRKETESVKEGQKIRSKKFKKVTWEAKIIKVHVHLKAMMSFKNVLEVENVLSSFKVETDEWHHHGVTVQQLFDSIQNKECLVYSPAQEPEKLYQQQNMVCVTVRQGDSLIVQTHHRTSDGKMHEALKPLERLMKASDDGQGWQDWQVRTSVRQSQRLPPQLLLTSYSSQALATELVRDNLKVAADLITIDTKSHKRITDARTNPKYIGLDQRIIVDTVDVYVQVECLLIKCDREWGLTVIFAGVSW